MNNEEKVQCKLCLKWFKTINTGHIQKMHNINAEEYLKLFPNSKLSTFEFSEKIKRNGIGNSNRLGKKVTEETKEKIRKKLIGIELSDETKEKMKGRIPWNKGLTDCYSEETLKQMSKVKIGYIPWNKGKINVYSEKSLKQMRISRIKEIENKYGIIFPNYNSKACEVFDWFNKEFNLNGQHALNGGEYFIKELGYWLDYYEPNLNIVIEWDEHHHYDVDGKLSKKDIIRQQEIENYLKCKFIRIKE